MQDKYYTPDIEEFRVGFEFEMEVGILSDPKWIKGSVSSGDVLITQDGFHACPSYIFNSQNELRVKYLDYSDMEEIASSLLASGFIFEYDVATRECVIRKGDGSVYFKGLIKNKSELKMLLKMIGL